MKIPPRAASSSVRGHLSRLATEHVIRWRAIELAVRSGRSLHQVTESDRDAARRELGAKS